jgi:ribosomal-protein-alanine N-acetyltransferase
MDEALAAGLDWAFGELGLHRVMANYLPRNERSGRLLARLGFEREGYAREYLKIAGRWEDHVLTAKISGSA